VAPQGTRVEFSFEHRDEESFQAGFGRMFEDSPLSAGLASGSAFLNRSLQSFMELAFYRLLDRKVSLPLRSDLLMGIGFNREAYDTPFGEYVIVDSFFLGPEVTQSLQEANNLSVSLGVNGQLALYDIYLSSDPKRLEDSESSTWFESVLKNWLGLLPLLQGLLPAVFEPNEMYDPLNPLKSAFALPTSVGAFQAMPVGVIRSYDISGEISLPMDLTQRLPKSQSEKLRSFESLEPGMGYSIATKGSFRMSVLKRDKNTAWVGLEKSLAVSGNLGVSLGKKIRLLEGVMDSSLWKPVAIDFKPLDGTIVDSVAEIFSQVFEFDLRQSEARTAYVAAMKGDFKPAFAEHDQRMRNNQPTGVKYLFSQDEEKIENKKTISPDLVFLQKKTEFISSYSNVVYNDPSGRYYRMRGRVEDYSRHVDLLSGQEDSIHSADVYMRVHKLGENYFAEDAQDPFSVDFHYRIRDRFTDSQEYRSYIDQLRLLTDLPLASVPTFARREPERVIARRKNVEFQSPQSSHLFLHTTPTQLGHFSANAIVQFDQTALKKLIDTPFSEFITHLSRYYRAENPSWFRYYLAYPSRFFFVHSPSSDYPAELSIIERALSSLRSAKDPFERLAGFRQLFSTRYPQYLVRTCIDIVGAESVSRSVQFFTKSSGNGNRETKDAYRQLSNKVFRSLKAPPPDDYLKASEQVLREFNPNEGLIERGQRAHMGRIILEQAEDNQIRIRLFSQDTAPKIKVYLRLAEQGPLDLVNFMLVEQVFELDAVANPTAENGREYVLALSGEDSPLRTSLFKNLLHLDGQYLVKLALRDDQLSWTSIKEIPFVVYQGMVGPL
jgi:hypothetical protein